MKFLVEKKFNYVPYTISTILVLWFILFSIMVFIPHHREQVCTINQTFENIIHVFLILFAFKIYNNASKDDKLIFKWYIVTNIFFFINDFVFYIIVYLPKNPTLISKNLHSLWLIFLNNTPFLVWLISVILFLSKILVRDIMSRQLFFKILAILIIFNLIIITLFLLPVGFHVSTGTIHNLFLVTGFIIESIIFDLAILCLIYSNNKSISLILSGFVILITGDFLITYCWLAKIRVLYSYGSFLWFLGMILMLWGILDIDYEKNYNIKGWFRNNKSIRSIVTFWAFIILLGSFFASIVIEFLFSSINKTSFIGLPFFIMVYSIIVVNLSGYVGKYFERPFKKIENNINAFLLDIENDHTYDNFSIEEFEYLQQFLIKVIEINDNQNQLYVSFGTIAANAVHDLGSPLLSINSAIDNIKNSKNGVDNLPALELSLSKVKEITSNLLIKYRMLTASNTYSPKLIIDKTIDEPRYINIIKLIDELIICKNIEWQQEPCNIKIEASLKNPLHFFSPTKLSRILSNLLNNAYESLITDKFDILISLSQQDTYLILAIQDKGMGIAEEKIKEVLSGVSFKHKGKGLGLSSALEYAKSLNGDLLINSKVNYGTEIILKFPVTPKPNWLATYIFYSSESKFVVLDDDPSIHMQLQLKLKDLDITSYHFMDADSYFEFINSLDNLQNLVYLVDLDLNTSGLSGFEIIGKSNLSDNPNVYLMTSDAEVLDVQNKVQLYKIKLIHKSILYSMQFCKTDVIQGYNTYES